MAPPFPPLAFLNTSSVETISNNFVLKAPPHTDIFASPVIGYHFSAPISYVSIPSQSFNYIRATISLPFTLSSVDKQRDRLSSFQKSLPNPTLHFDQAGLVFVLPHSSLSKPDKNNPGDKTTHPQWVKAGVEVWNGESRGSVVARDRWSDWSLFEIPEPEPELDKKDEQSSVIVTMEMEKMGDALMIYCVNGLERVLVRKVPWCFLECDSETELWVGVYGARPDSFDEAQGKELVCSFTDLVIR